MIDVIYS